MKFYKKAIVFFLFISIYNHVFASNELFSGMSRLILDDFLIFSGKEADREQMIANDFNLPGFVPYNKERLINSLSGDNYHVFKTFFKISDDFINKDLTLYINHFDMPVTIRVNDIIVYQKGLRLSSDGVYSAGDQKVYDVPLSKGLIDYNIENSIVIEVFPQFETSPLPELSIAEYKDNALKVFIKNLLHLYLVLAAQFVALLVAIYHFSMFISRGCKDTKYVLFSLISFSFVLAYANIGFTLDFNHYVTVAKITRCFQLLCIGFFSLFIVETSDLFVKQKKYIMAGIAAFSAVCALYIAFQKDLFTVNTAFSVMSGIYLTPLLLFCICITIISIVLRKKLKFIPLLVSTLIVVAASLRDLMMLNRSVQPLFWYAPYTYLLLVIIIYGILVYEESSLFKNFKRYVPADLVIQLINQNITAKLGGKQQELTVFFSDIAKFTSIVEKMEPQRLIQDLCIYFENISKTIIKYNGTIDKYIGDAVMAFWGAPVPLENHAQKACQAALNIRDNLSSLFRQWDDIGKDVFLTRIGIHTGNVIVGNIGYKERLNYTVIGDTVNVSSRLEGVNKIYGTEIIVSENTYRNCPDDFEFRLLDRVSLVGRYEGMNIYELISLKGYINKRMRKIYDYYEIGLQHYFNKNWTEALKYINTVLKYCPNDSPSSLMRKRIILYQKKPPPEQWDGVFTQTTK